MRVNNLIVTNIKDLTSEQLNEISIVYEGKVQYVQDFTEDDACVWSDIEILITYGRQVNKEFLDKCPNLKWIQVFQSGVERFPLEEVKNREILLTNIKGIHGIPMSEFVLSSILYFSRNIPKYIKDKKNHYWDSLNLVEEAHGKVVGIFGAGTIGQELAEKIKILGMKVYGLNTSGESRPNFEKMYSSTQKMELLEQCDFVLLLLPLTEKTKNYIGEAELKRMKKDSYLINIGRGPLLNENAFIRAIKNNEIKGGALDVFNNEPLPKDSPLWNLENVLITPHMAAKSVNFVDRCIKQFIPNYILYSKNQPLKNLINLTKGY